MVAVGDIAPGFTLPNQDGENVSLADYRGDRVIVFFFPRADTPGCTTEACSFRDHWSAFQDQGIHVIGISDDPVDDLKDFQMKYELPMALLSDETGEVARQYDSYGEKQMFGNTFDGVFRNTFVIGPDGSVEAVFANVTPEDHAAEILEATESNQ